MGFVGMGLAPIYYKAITPKHGLRTTYCGLLSGDPGSSAMFDEIRPVVKATGGASFAGIRWQY
jgi:hypothetical protein